MWWSDAHRQKALATRRAQGHPLRAAFAELIAEGYTISAACRELGCCRQYGTRMMAQLLKEMGE